MKPKTLIRSGREMRQIKVLRGEVIQGSEKQVFTLGEKSESRWLFASGRVTHSVKYVGHWADNDWTIR